MSELQKLVDEAYWAARAAAADPALHAEILHFDWWRSVGITARYAQARAATLSLADRKLRGVE